jgi:DNA-binding response OmpR family regulator
MCNVAIFEDEPVLQMMWEDIAEAAGFEVSGVCSSIEECLEFAKHGRMDIAIVDVNLGGQRSDEIIEQLEARGISVLVCTGMDAEDLPAMFHRHDILKKPFTLGSAVGKLSELATLEG